MERRGSGPSTRTSMVQGLRLQAGTSVDACIIATPSSTKNQRRERDPGVHQMRKGNESHFGVGADPGLSHSLNKKAGDARPGAMPVIGVCSGVQNTPARRSLGGSRCVPAAAGNSRRTA